MDNYEQSFYKADFEHAMQKQEQEYKAGIKKLIELLNEFGKERQTQLNRPIFIKDRDNQSILISKHFLFIQRLVENNKIDFEKVKENADYYYIKMFDDDEILLMLLSIQEDPISFLISILK